MLHIYMFMTFHNGCVFFAISSYKYSNIYIYVAFVIMNRYGSHNIRHANPVGGNRPQHMRMYGHMVCDCN